MHGRRAGLRVLTALLLAFVACGYDWTVVPKGQTSSGTASGKLACGENGLVCDIETSYCVETLKGDVCAPWPCAEHDCACAEQECADAKCIDKGGAVVVSCP